MNRRHFLRGLGGIAVGLPLLEGLQPKIARGAPNGFPKRLVVFFTCNGVNMSGFFPSTPFGALSAASFGADRSLKALAPWANKLLIPRGLHMVPRGYGRDPGPGDDHAKGMGCKLTAAPLIDAGNKYASGISIDQLVAQKLNPSGRSALNLQVGFAGGDGLGIISYKGPGQPVKAEPNPRTAFEDLMGVSTTTDPTVANRLKVRKESVLDLVKGDMDRLKLAPLSVADKQKLDMHFSYIRSVETGTMMPGTTAPSCGLPTETVNALKALNGGTVQQDGEYRKVGRLHLDVMAIALACGSTRSATILWGRGSGGPIFRWDGMSHDFNHHKLSHGTTLDNGGAAVAGYEKMLFDIDAWHATQYAYLLERMSSYQEGSGTLLDNSAVLWANELSDGKEHNYMDQPIVIAGSAGGYLKQGQYIKVTAQTNPKNDVDAPHNQLLTTLLNAVGVKADDGGPVTNFGKAGKAGEITALKA